MTETLAQLSNNAHVLRDHRVRAGHAGAHRRVGDGRDVEAGPRRRDRSPRRGRRRWSPRPPGRPRRLDHRRPTSSISDARTDSDAERPARTSSAATARPDRLLADRARPAAADGRRGLPRSGGRAGAVGQHVRVRDHGLAGGRRRRTSLLVRRYAIRWLGPVRHRLPRDRARPGRRSCCTGPVGPTGAGAALVLARASTSRRRRSPAVRSRRRARLRAVPAAQPARGRRPRRTRSCRAVASSGGLPTGRVDRPGGLPGARVRVPAVDVRRAGRRDLGGVRLGPLLGLGPQGGLGVHHLGRLRRLPARARDGRLAGPGRGVRRAARLSRRSCSTSSASTCSAPGLHAYSGM